MIKSILRKKYFCSKLKLTHSGESKMVNIGEKENSLRFAKAIGYVKTSKDLIDYIKNNPIEKGDVLRISEIAGIMAAKKTSDLIPLCHQININTCKINISIEDTYFMIESYVESFSKTGVEMEAIISCQITASTIYDMCKSIDKKMIITDIKIIEKSGGRSGYFKL